jgi:serine/threonine-protein kinase
MSSEADGAAVLSTGEVLKDRYVIEKEIGRGGFGAVYLARDQQLLSKQVVVKVLLGEASRDSWIQRKFQQELEALARIDHPGVVGILDVGVAPAGQAFLVMQFVEGVTLRSVIQSGGMDLTRAAPILRQIGQALEAAHEKGVVHRDLKPENVMLLSPAKGEEYVKLIDFGIAAVKHSQAGENLVSSKIAGTFAYMAPEQLMGKPSPASDVYSFGIIAFEMLTGQRPEMQPQGVKTPPCELRPGLPVVVQAAILKALSFHAEERYGSPREFGEQLATALTSGALATLVSAVAPAASPAVAAPTVMAPAPPFSAPAKPSSTPSQPPSLEMAYVLLRTWSAIPCCPWTSRRGSSSCSRRSCGPHPNSSAPMPTSN